MPQEFFRFARVFAAVGICALVAACGGGGGGFGGGDGGGGGGGARITVSGRITFDRLQFNTVPNTGLNGANPVESPAREVVVEAVSNSTALASTTTDSNGNYSLSVPANTTVLIRARAQMLKTGAAPTWNFTVRNNANSDAVYALQGENFNTGTANVTRNLRATSGWGTNSYTGDRTAAPFAILDTVYGAKQLIFGAAPTAAFTDLNLYWSTKNKNAGALFCPDDGIIGTSFYSGDPQARDACTQTGNLLPAGIYILGDFVVGDTDEFDAHVIAHEFGHYFEDNFSRSDSIGGEHSSGGLLDLRVAFGEGWGNAFAGMTQNDPVYRDSQNGISTNFSIDLESGSAGTEGWFSEASVGEFIWDVFDSNTTPEAGDNVALGFGPILTVMTGAQVTTEALTSVFSFATALRAGNATSSGAIGDLLNGEEINGTGAFGAGESNDGGIPGVLPVYRPITLGGAGQVYVCNYSNANASNTDDVNKLGNSSFLRFDNDQSRSVVIRADGVANSPTQVGAADPDIYVYRRGETVAAGESGGPDVPPATRRVESLSTTLAAGTYVIELIDFEFAGANQPPRCMTVSITG